MLRKEIKIYYLFAFLLIYYSCSTSTNNIKNGPVCSLISNNYVHENFKLYSNEFEILNDSINIYQDSLVKSFLFIYNESWQLDSMICINSLKDRLVAAINVSYGIGKQGTSDDISKILGKKINNKWYFFMGGGNLVVPRSMYGKSEMNPLTFHELSQIARKEFLESALIKNEKGEYIINDKWIDDHFYNAGFDNFNYHKNPGMVSEGEEYQLPRDKEKTDSVHWYLIIHKWTEKIDTNEYKPLRKNKLNS
jgi:hypothetical protein